MLGDLSNFVMIPSPANEENEESNETNIHDDDMTNEDNAGDSTSNINIERHTNFGWGLLFSEGAKIVSQKGNLTIQTLESGNNGTVGNIHLRSYNNIWLRTFYGKGTKDTSGKILFEASSIKPSAYCPMNESYPTLGTSKRRFARGYFKKLNISTSILPYKNNEGSIGTSQYRWKNGYINNLATTGDIWYKGSKLTLERVQVVTGVTKTIETTWLKTVTYYADGTKTESEPSFVDSIETFNADGTKTINLVLYS